MCVNNIEHNISKLNSEFLRILFILTKIVFLHYLSDFLHSRLYPIWTNAPEHQGPVFQNGVRPGVSLNLTKSATKPKITIFKTA